MDRVSNQFLTRSALTGNQDRNVGTRDLFYGPKNFLHLGAGAEKVFEGFAGTLVHQFPAFAVQLLNVDGAVDNDLQLVDVNRFGKEVIGALSDGFESVFLLALPGYHLSLIHISKPTRQAEIS